MAETKLYGVLAEFKNPYKLYHACEKVRDEGFKNWDAHTPFPVHGLDRAMGLPASKLPWITLVMGLTGACVGFGLQAVTHALIYPINLAAKPIFAWPAYIPITFEVGVLFGALSSVFGMLIMNGLPRWNHPLFQSEKFKRVTDDKFFISIEAVDPKFSKQETIDFLNEIGALSIEIIEDN